MIFYTPQGAAMYVTFEPGKLTDEVKTHVPDATKLLAQRKAARMGMTLSDYLRDLVLIDLHGAPYDELMSSHRRAIRAGTQGQLATHDWANTGPDLAQEKANA
jgi:hypothetical protein